MTEILSPAGSAEHARAAVLAGADAVYLGLKRFMTWRTELMVIPT